MGCVNTVPFTKQLHWVVVSSWTRLKFFPYNLQSLITWNQETWDITFPATDLDSQKLGRSSCICQHWQSVFACLHFGGPCNLKCFPPEICQLHLSDDHWRPSSKLFIACILGRVLFCCFPSSFVQFLTSMSLHLFNLPVWLLYFIIWKSFWDSFA